MKSARKIKYCVGLVFLLLCMARVGAAQTTCNPTWVSTTAYTAGMKVSLNGINYTANFWTQGQNPATNNGGSGSGQAPVEIEPRIEVTLGILRRQYFLSACGREPREAASD